MRPFLQISSLLLIALTAAASYMYLRSGKEKLIPANFKGMSRSKLPGKPKSKEMLQQKLNRRGQTIEAFSKAKNLNTEISFLIDMGIESGSSRFFVYNLKKDSIEVSGLVTHGYGSSTLKGLQFSNIPGSNATSLGKYRVGDAYMGRFGLAYKLHGLEKQIIKLLKDL